MKRLLVIALLSVLLSTAPGAWGQAPPPGKSGSLQYHAVSLRNYMFVDIGMSEAQVINILGPPSWVDRWSCESDEGCHLKKVYYYLGDPAKREMTTVIYFTDGKVTRKERYRSWLSW